MMMRPVTTLPGGAARCLRAVLAGRQWSVLRGGWGVGVDSWTPGRKRRCHRHRTGPHPEWTLVDSVDSRRPGRGQPDGRRSTHHALGSALLAGVVGGLAGAHHLAERTVRRQATPGIELRR